MNDFDRSILARTSHRPWPMPAEPWLMTQTWHDLLFAHWRVDEALLRPHVPERFPVDRFEGSAWIGVVPFRMTNVAPRGVPALPWISAFPELNVRTYVTVGGRAGVYFFSLDAANSVAVLIARTCMHLPYFTAAMRCETSAEWVDYRSERPAGGATQATFIARYRPVGAVQQPVAGTLEHFLTERYCLFTVDRKGRAYTLDIHHPPWPLQPAEAQIQRNTMADASGIHLPPVQPLLHFSRRQDMVGWRIKKV